MIIASIIYISILNFSVKKNKTKSENIGKRNLLLVDPDLPPGWVRKVRIKKDVQGPEKFQVYIIKSVSSVYFLNDFF